MTTRYIVKDTVDAEPLAEALGRMLAVAQGKPYPIPSTFPDGSPDPDPSHATRYAAVTKLSASGTQTAFIVDEFVTSCLGQTIATEEYGNVTVPTVTVELDESWFPEVER